MNVKLKALSVVTLIILILSGFFLHQGISQHNDVIDLTIEKEEEVIENTIADLQKYFFSAYVVRIRQLAENREDIRRAFAERDRELLYRLARPVYEDLREENEYFHAWDFNLPDGTVFLRVQKPKLHGDNIRESREIVQAVHESGRQHSGYDIGKHGAIYWVAQPLLYDDTYIGAMEFGLPVTQLIDDLKAKFQTEVTTIIDVDLWDKATLVERGFRRFGDKVLSARAGSIYEKLPEDFVFAGGRDQRVDIDDSTYILHSCSVLKNYRDEAIGALLFLQDISAKVASKRNFILITVTVTALLICCSLLVLYLSFTSLIGRLERYADETRKAREESEGARNELEHRVRERTAELNTANNYLKEQHVFLQTIVESLTQPFYVIDAQTYRIVMANRAAYSGSVPPDKQLTCYSMTHNRTEPCSGEEHPCSLLEVKKTGQPQILEHVHSDKEGKERFVEVYAYPVLDRAGKVIQVIEYCVDITERKKSEEERAKLEAQLRQAQKMESMGTLAGGIAHDFNNILSAIFGFTDLLRYELPPESDAQSKLNEVLKAANRAKDLVKQILTFSRQVEHERRPFQVHLLVKEVLKLLRASMPATIEIREDINDSGLILADATQIHQVVMNLCTNAYHAMRDKGGVLAVSLSSVEISREDQKAASLSLVPGKYVKLGVSDTGHGIERSAQDRIFDPYFTTKKKGEGTGLGLAVVHGIVKSHGGLITVYSEPGIGTTFNVYLPHFEPSETDHEEAAVEQKVPAIEPLPGGTERIMFVDDEEQIAEAGRQMLESLGYRVEAFTKGPVALKAFQEKPEAYDLVMTDMTMPSLTGRELAQKILALRPGIPIVLCTGFSELIDRERSEVIGIREFVMKPIVKADLARIVRRALDREE